MYESFDFIDEGIIYCKVVEIKKDTIVLEANGNKKEFDKETIIKDINPGDYVRVYVKDNKVIYIEKISEEFYKKIKELNYP